MLPNLCNGVVWSAGSLQTFNSTDTYTNMSRLRNRIIYTFEKTILNSAQYLHITLTIAQSWPQECGLTYKIEDCACINKQKRFASAFRGRNRVTFRGVAWRPRVWACNSPRRTPNIVSFQLRSWICLIEQFPIERRKQFEISSRHPLNQSDAGFSRLFSPRFLIGSFWYVPLHLLVVVITLVLVNRYSVEMHFTIFKH